MPHNLSIEGYHVVVTEHCLEKDRDHSWRVVVDGSAALDVLTDRETIARARTTPAIAASGGLAEERLVTFGPFGVSSVPL